MHAYLEQDGVWEKTADVNDILDHQGRMVVCDTAEDDEAVTEKIVAETGMFAMKHFRGIFVSDVPIFDGLTEDAERLAKHGPVKIFSQSSSVWAEVKVAGKYVRFHYPESWRNEEPKPGLILTDNPGRNDIFDLTYDLNLWEKAKEKLRRQRKHQNDNAVSDADTLSSVAQQLSTSMGLGEIKRFRTSQFLVWISAHDQFHGRRATNRIILGIAKAWAKNQDKHTKKFRQHIPETVLEKLEERLKKIVRFPELKNPPV